MGFAAHEEGERISFEVGRLAATGIAELATGFEESESLGSLAEVVFGGRNESGSQGRTQDGVVFTEWAGDFDEIAIDERTDGQAIAEL